MTEIRYANLHQSTPALTVQTMGGTYGPPGGDNWSLVASLPAAAMPSGSGQYAVIVSGKVGSRYVDGPGTLRGVWQLCLGTTAGTKLAHMRVSHTLHDAFDVHNGIPFQFVLLVSSGFADPVLGSSFDPAVSELCLYARCYLNGDPQTYTAQFNVADLTWLWFDLARIPSTKWTADRDTSTVTLAAAAPSAFTRVSPSAFGSAGQLWLNFGNLWYEPRGHMAMAPRFAFYGTPDGTWAARVPRVGSHGRWGQNRFPATGNLGEVPSLQQGCFWLYTHLGSTAKAGYTGQDPNNLARVFRWTHFAVRVDDLPDFLGRSDGGPFVAGVRVDGAWRDTYVVKERPAPNPGLLTEPIVMAHLVPTFGQQTASYGAWVTEAGRPGLAFGDSQAFPQADGTRGEAVSVMAFGRRNFTPLSPEMQWRIHMVGSQSLSPTLPQQLYDLHFLQFHPVSDPAGSSTPPYPVPLPILVVPGRQSASAAALSPPPSLPNASVQQRRTDDRPGIAGGTGYLRTWPLGAKLLRELSLTWGPLPLLEAQAVFDFLVANPAWRYTPPGGTAIAVLNSTPPTLEADQGQLAAVVAVDIAVLAFTA